jgi:hypothetical protein
LNQLVGALAGNLAQRLIDLAGDRRRSALRWRLTLARRWRLSGLGLRLALLQPGRLAELASGADKRIEQFPGVEHGSLLTCLKLGEGTTRVRRKWFTLLTARRSVRLAFG